MTRTVKCDVPGLVGVPLIVPVLLSVIPCGNVPVRIVQLYGKVPPVAARLCE